MTSEDQFLESIPEPPEVKACLSIIFEYLERRLTLEEAAPRLRDAFRANPQGLNLEMSPRLRALFSEIAKLDGHPAPDLGPDPDRHKSRGSDMLERLPLEAWRAIERYPGQPRSFRCCFAAPTETTAHSIRDWLQNHGHETRLESPEQVDADDWQVIADTPTIQWTREAVDEWVDSVRNTPLDTEASFTGWSV